MNKVGIRIGIALLVLVSIMGTAYAESSNIAPTDYKPVAGTSPISPEGVKKILLIEDVLPWGMDSNHAALAAMGLPYNTVNTTGLPNVIWNDYSLVIVASDQPQTFHDTLRPYISPGGALYNWVSAGGVLNFHGAISGWNGGDWTLSYKLPGGIGGVFDPQNNVTVTGPTAPLPPAKGPYRAITDADIDNWGASTHGYFKYVGGDIKPSLVVVTLTVSDAPTKPVYLLYTFGKGAVLTTQQTLEWGYYNGLTPNSKYALYNDIMGGRYIDNLIS